MNHRSVPDRPSTLDRAFGGAIHALSAVGRIGQALGSALTLPGLPSARPPEHPFQPGAAPGIESIPNVDVPPEPGLVRICCIDYDADRLEAHEVDDLDAFFTRPRPDWSKVRWINIDGQHPYVVNRFREHYQFHTLAAEDVLHVPQRPRVEPYPSHLFVVLRMLMLVDDHLISEQLSIFLYPGLVITFQERQGDVFDFLRARLERDGSRVRSKSADFLLYALLDAVVDHSFPLLERYGEILEDLDHLVMERPQPETLRKIQSIKRELISMRRVLWPTRDLVDTLYRGEHEGLSEITKTFLRDVYAHTVQVIDILETYRETCSSLTDLYMSMVSNRTNEIMRVLTVMASLFIPITFLAGVYGMNFEYFPELKWHYSYFVFWGICAAVVSGLLLYFHRRGWLRRG